MSEDLDAAFERGRQEVLQNPRDYFPDMALLDAIACGDVEVRSMGTTVPYQIVTGRDGVLHYAGPSADPPVSLRTALVRALGTRTTRDLAADRPRIADDLRAIAASMPPDSAWEKLCDAADILDPPHKRRPRRS